MYFMCILFYSDVLTFVDNGVDLATRAWLAAKGLIGWKTALAKTPDISAVG